MPTCHANAALAGILAAGLAGTLVLSPRCAGVDFEHAVILITGDELDLPGRPTLALINRASLNDDGFIAADLTFDLLGWPRQTVILCEPQGDARAYTFTDIAASLSQAGGPSINSPSGAAHAIAFVGLGSPSDPLVLYLYQDGALSEIYAIDNDLGELAIGGVSLSDDMLIALWRASCSTQAAGGRWRGSVMEAGSDEQGRAGRRGDQGRAGSGHRPLITDCEELWSVVSGQFSLRSTPSTVDRKPFRQLIAEDACLPLIHHIVVINANGAEVIAEVGATDCSDKSNIALLLAPVARGDGVNGRVVWLQICEPAIGGGPGGPGGGAGQRSVVQWDASVPADPPLRLGPVASDLPSPAPPHARRLGRPGMNSAYRVAAYLHHRTQQGVCTLLAGGGFITDVPFGGPAGAGSGGYEPLDSPAWHVPGPQVFLNDTDELVFAAVVIETGSSPVVVVPGGPGEGTGPTGGPGTTLGGGKVPEHVVGPTAAPGGGPTRTLAIVFHSAASQSGMVVRAGDVLPGGYTVIGELRVHAFNNHGDVLYTALLRRDRAAGAGRAGDDHDLMTALVLARALPPPIIGQACPADINGDGEVDALDLLILAQRWGDGQVHEETLVWLQMQMLLRSWGPCTD